MGIFERLGSIDPKGEREAKLAQREILDRMTEDIDPTIIGEILTKLRDGNIDDLPPELRAVVEKMKQQASDNGHSH